MDDASLSPIVTFLTKLAPLFGTFYHSHVTEMLEMGMKRSRLGSIQDQNLAFKNYSAKNCELGSQLDVPS